MQDSIMKKNIWRTVWALAFPTILEQLLTTVLQYVDTAMVGHVNAQASAAVGLTASVGWLINSPMSSAAVGCLVIVSKAVGENNRKKVEAAADQALLLTLMLGVVEGALALASAPFIPVWMGAEEEIRRDASVYFAIICLPMIFRAASVILGMVIRATGNVRTPMLINLAANGANAVLNYLLIYPSHSLSAGGVRLTVWGAGMGAIGAGIATAISYLLAGIGMYIAFRCSKVLNGRHMPKYHKSVMYACVRLALPVAMTKMVSCLGYVTFAGMVTGLGTVTFAAHTIANTAESLFYIPAFGMQTAASSLAGYAWGKGDHSLYKKFSLRCIGGIFILMALSGGLLYLFAEPIMSFFTKDREVIRQGAAVLRIVAPSEPLYGIAVVIEGLFNGVGHTRFPFLVECCCMWGVRILSTYLCVAVFGLGLDAVWYCMVADNVCKAAAFAVRFTLPGIFRAKTEKE